MLVVAFVGKVSESSVLINNNVRCSSVELQDNQHSFTLNFGHRLDSYRLTCAFMVKELTLSCDAA